jgi:hypothetical protein
MKKWIWSAVGVSLVAFILYYLHIFPLIIQQTADMSTKPDYANLEQGDTVKPLEKLVIEGENTHAYLVFSDEDLKYLPKEMNVAKVLKTNDPVLIRKIATDFQFKYTGGDVSTCESEFYITINNKVVYKSKISLENKIGLQNEYGWLEAIDDQVLINDFILFTPVYSPVVFL